MIGHLFLRALDVPALLRHLAKVRAERQVDQSERELELYQRVFGTEFLHVGYFKDPAIAPEDISLRMLTDAMQAYAELVLDRIGPDDAGHSVIDIGCGVGGLLRMLRDRGLKPAGLTPNVHHAALIRERLPDVPVHVAKFEELDAAALPARYDLATSTEAFHQVPIDAGLQQLKTVVRPGGRLILIDYYRLHKQTRQHSGHYLADFEAGLKRHGIEVTELVDIGPNTLPSLALAHCWATRLGVPLIEYNVDRFFRRHAVLGYFLQRARDRMKQKADHLDTLDPSVLAQEKAYLVHQLRLPA